MFELTDTFSDIYLEGGNTTKPLDLVKGGFPRIKICDNKIVQNIINKRPREFSNKNIMSIKEMINSKKSNQEPMIDLIIDQPNIIIDRESGSYLKKINNIPIDFIIGK
jgi:CO dehydrogenase/acetyl-CoA synthase alpha subunit